MPSNVKEQLCRALLEEFGAVAIRHRPSQGELTHACLVSPEKHSDQLHNPTASLNYEKLTYKCLGCQAQGGILWLITELRRCTYEEAREWLSRETGTGGVVMPLQQLLDYYDALYADSRKRPLPIPVFSEAILEPWLKIVHPMYTTGVEDLGVKGRGIPEQNVLDLKLGWNSVEDRLVIPHFWKGQLVGWQSRRLSGGGPKYLSTEDMPKDQTLYDYDAKRREAIIMEAPLSVARHRHELPVEGTFGSAVTDRQISLISAHFERMILWMDNDEGGWKALEGTAKTPGMIERASKYGSVWVVDSPFAGDPGELETRAAVAVLEEYTIPAVSWKRPRWLACHLCYQQAHQGPCHSDENREEVER